MQYFLLETQHGAGRAHDAKNDTGRNTQQPVDSKENVSHNGIRSEEIYRMLVNVRIQPECAHTLAGRVHFRCTAYRVH